MLAALSLAMASVPTAGAGATGGPCPPLFHVEDTPNPHDFNALEGIDQGAPDDVWAVGRTVQMSENDRPQPLVLHWDGTTWSSMDTPTLLYGGQFLDVAVAGPGEVWAIGEQYDLDYRPRPLVERWDGTEWTVVSNPVTGDAFLHGVDVAGPDDVWAVGYTFGARTEPLAIHWDGVSWTIVPTIPTDRRTALFDVSAVAPDDVWAVGTTDDVDDALVLHWDGQAWARVSAPPLNGFSLRGVAAVAADDAWAVGVVYEPGVGDRTFTMHWDGSSWTVVSSPNQDDPNGQPRDNHLQAVAAFRPGHAWAVGYSIGFPVLRPLIMRWNGAEWRLVRLPALGQGDVDLRSVAAAPGKNVWAAGRQQNELFQDETLILRRCR